MGSTLCNIYYTGHFAADISKNIIDMNELICFEELASLVETDTQRRTSGHLIVDVRNPGEIAKHGVIPTSINVPMKEIETVFHLPPSSWLPQYGVVDLAGADHLVLITHCRSGVRAVRAANTLNSLGYNNCRIYSGSMLDW